MSNWRVIAGLIAILAIGGWLATSGTADDEPAEVERQAKPALKIVVFGDSITGHRPGQAYLGKYAKYADLLQLLLEGRYGVGAVEVINSGWAGDATYAKPGEGFPGAVARLNDDLLSHKPDIAIVLIGGNDQVNSDADRQRTQANLNQIAERIAAADIKLLMLAYHPAIADPETGKPWDHLDDKNDLIAAAAKSVDAPLLDMAPVMRAAVKKYPPIDLLNAVDGVHLNVRGEFVYARAIFQKLDELKWIQPCSSK
jgi:lysophospholipase L1-like esterase